MLAVVSVLGAGAVYLRATMARVESRDARATCRETRLQNGEDPRACQYSDVWKEYLPQREDYDE